MIVEITDKGRNYLHDITSGNKDIGASGFFDKMILEVVVEDGEHDIDRGLASHESRGRAGSIEVGSLRSSFRRMFEAGYIEQV